MAEAVLEVALGNLSSLIGKELELYLGFDDVLCDMVPIEVVHVFLGRP